MKPGQLLHRLNLIPTWQCLTRCTVDRLPYYCNLVTIICLLTRRSQWISVLPLHFLNFYASARPALSRSKLMAGLKAVARSLSCWPT